MCPQPHHGRCDPKRAEHAHHTMTLKYCEKVLGFRELEKGRGGGVSYSREITRQFVGKANYDPW